MSVTFRSRLARRLIASGLALFLDRLVGEPPEKVHPVAGFGRLMQIWEGLIWRGTKSSGVIYGMFGVSISIAAASAADTPFFGTLLWSYVAIAERSLLSTARFVALSAGAGNLESARDMLPSLVGRDVDGIDEVGIARAVVESVAENSSDAVVAPMVYGALFGGRGAAFYRAVNTMDAMVGHKTEIHREFGWASARLDDVINYIPARLAALCAWTVPFGRRPAPLAVISDASGHPSPNAGIVESTFAHRLGIRLGGGNVYQGRKEYRTEMGPATPATFDDVYRAADLCRSADSLLALTLIMTGIAVYIRGAVGR